MEGIGNKFTAQTDEELQHVKERVLFGIAGDIFGIKVLNQKKNDGFRM